jgi:hypothetical protein
MLAVTKPNSGPLAYLIWKWIAFGGGDRWYMFLMFIDDV